MISLFSSLSLPRPRTALFLSLALALPLSAQEGVETDCRANTGGQGWDCAPLGTLPEPEFEPPARSQEEIDQANAELDAIERGPLDWVDIESTPEALQDYKCLSCSGRYLDPLITADKSIPPELADIEATAQESTLQGGTATLTGGVKVTQGYRQLEGDTATFNRETEIGTISGNITVREPGILFQGEHAKVNASTGEALIEQSQFVVHDMHFRGSAQQLRRDEQGLLHIEDGGLSYCAPEDSDWAIRANTMELNLDEGVGTARGAKIELGGVPVFYAPWLRFPLNDSRKTGVLWPSLGSDSKGGVDIAVPVYLNLKPNYDALYIPRFIEERGVNHELEARYLNRYLGYWSVGGAYMNDDKRYKDEFPDERNHDRWLAVAKHDGLFEERWRSKVDFSRASDVNYLKDLDTSSLDTKRQTSLLQLGSLDYLGDNWLVETEVQQFQSLADDLSNDYKKLPQITGRYRSDGMPFSFEPILLAQYSDFDTDDERVKGERIYAEAGMGYPMQWTYGFVRPLVKYRQIDYDLNEPVRNGDDSTPSVGTGLASIDGGLFFERQTEIGGTGMVHTLEPRIYYLYSDYEDQTEQPDFDSAELTFSYNQLFRETRFSGRDRLDDANQMSLGVTTRFIGDTDGREYLSASLGQIFYFDDRRVRLKPKDPPMTQSGSELAAELTYSPSRQVDVRGSVLWDPYSGEVNVGNVQANYMRDDGSVFNAGYTFRRPAPGVQNQPVTEQFHLSTYLPLWSNEWRLFAAWNYSLEADKSIEDMYGLEYDSCCWMVRLMHLRYFDNIPGTNPDFNDPNLERENSTQVQIVLKGMGGFGSRVSGILEDMIRGFRDREY